MFEKRNRSDCINYTILESYKYKKYHNRKTRVINTQISDPNHHSKISFFPFSLFRYTFPNSSLQDISHHITLNPTRPDPINGRSYHRFLRRLQQPPSPNSDTRRRIAVPSAINLCSRWLRLCSHGGVSCFR